MQNKIDVASLVNYYDTGKIIESIRILKTLQAAITQCMKDVQGYECSNDFYSSLIKILCCETSKHSPEKSADFELVSSVICCVRNSFYKSPANQLMVSQNEEWMSKLIDALKLMLDHTECPSQEQNNKHESQEMSKQALSSWATCFVNMMAGNNHARINVWKHLEPYHRKMISVPPWEAAHLFSAVLHNLLLESSIREEIHRGENFEGLVVRLLSLYLHEGPNSCFVLFCLKDCLCSASVLPSVWDDLTVEESLLSLDILSSVILAGSASSGGQSTFPPWEVVEYFCEKFKKNSDKILCTHDGRLHLIEPKVVARLLSLICSAAASDNFCKSLQEDKSLLITAVYLLKGMTDIGDVSDNYFSRLDDTPGKENELKEASSHPSFGFKSELIRLIASLVFRHEENQNTVREIKGLELLLENSQFDARNPFIREDAIFALRNLLEGNEANQSYVKGFTLEGVAPNPVLQHLGLQAEVSAQGKLTLHQTPKG